MENNNIIIILLVIIVILLAAIGVMLLNPADSNVKTDEGTVDETTSDPVTPDTIKVGLPEFDTRYVKTVGEYKVEAEKWMGGSVGGFEVHLYKNGEIVDKDSYLTRAYFYMDGEWKWSEWGNGEDGYEGYHRYPVAQGVEIQEVEVKF
jgi:hypothetical protein